MSFWKKNFSTSEAPDGPDYFRGVPRLKMGLRIKGEPTPKSPMRLDLFLQKTKSLEGVFHEKYHTIFVWLNKIHYFDYTIRNSYSSPCHYTANHFSEPKCIFPAAN